MNQGAAGQFGAPPTGLREKIAQLIMVRIGSNLPPVMTAADDEARVAKLLGSCPVGGLLLFNGGMAAKGVLARLQEQSEVPLLVGSDVERGVGQQCKGYTVFPHAMAFERLGDDAPAAVRQFAESLAAEARDVGIHITFGPVADVNTNRRNPIIATRAFSEEPARAAELCAAYVTAAEAAGLNTTAKHFPGHGDTQQDSHDSLPAVPRSLSQLEACELVPFKSAIDAGCSLVMTAHVAFPELDPSGQPATLSRPILHDVLRDRLGFKGVVCSDSLLMAGVRDRFATEGEMAEAALAAGVDLLLDIRAPGEVIAHLAASVECGALSRERVEEAFERVWALKTRVFGHRMNGGGVSRPPEKDAASLAQSVARRAIRVVDNDASTALPFDRAKPLVAVLFKPFATPLDPPEQPLAEALRTRFGDVHYIELGPNATAEEIETTEQAAHGASQLLVAMIVKPAAWHAFGLLPAQRALVERLCRGRELVLVSLGVPYALDDYPDVRTRICTYSDVPVSQEALADFVRGV